MCAAGSRGVTPDRLEKAKPGDAVDVWIYSAFQKDNWVARKSADFTRAEHPGTAIQIEEQIYEIMTAQETLEPGYAIRYGLKKWDEQHAVRRVVPYTPQVQEQLASDYLDEAHRQALRSRILWLFPIAGMAPDSLQRQWEEKSALNMTMLSAVSALSGFLIYMSLVQAFGKFPPNKWLFFVTSYIGFDSFVRLLWVVFSGEPHGMVVLNVPYHLWEVVTQPEKRRWKKEKAKLELEPDVVIRRPSSKGLLIRSMVLDDLLTGSNPVRFEGEAYQPLHWSEEGAGLRRRWVYELTRIEMDPKRRYREYTRPRTPERQKIVETYTHNRDRVFIFAHIWGTFSQEEQLRLAAKYHFPAAKWTAVTAGLFLAAASLEVWLDLVLGPTIFNLAPAGYLFLESSYRLYQSKAHGQPVGSVVGFFLRPFFRPPQ